jgi:VIT1/CCC1 family predicted Fe2+/Mn2+ transporter
MELSEIRGGIRYGLLGLGAALVTFIIGVIDGYQRPLSCNG